LNDAHANLTSPVELSLTGIVKEKFPAVTDWLPKVCMLIERFVSVVE
jgi:hypothetical protein